MKNALWHNQGDAAHTGPKLPGYANLEELCHAFQAKGLDGLQVIGQQDKNVVEPCAMHASSLLCVLLYYKLLEVNNLSWRF